MIRVTPGRETMNIPEISTELKVGIRSESGTPAQVVDETQGHNGSARAAPDITQQQETSQQNRQPETFSKEKLDELVMDVEQFLERNDIQLKFNVLEEDDTVQVEIVDSDGKTIRKIPGDDLLKLSKSLKNLERGFLDEVS